MPELNILLLLNSLKLNLFKISRHIFLAVLLALFVLACKKKQNTTLGTDVQPESDALYTMISDTSTIQAHTIKHPKTRSYQDQYKYLGSNQDPVFGRTNASIYTNFSIPNNVSGISFGEDVALDSAELILTFTQSFVGDTTVPLYYQVHQLTEALSRTAAYYLDTNLTYNATAIGSCSRRITKKNGYYCIRIPLDKTFASAIISNPQYLTDNTTFQNTYKGFYITTKNSNMLNPGNQGALLKIDLDNIVSGLYMYYHNGPYSASKASKEYRFTFSGDYASRFNNIEYNPFATGANHLLTDQIVFGDSAKGKQGIFLKGVGGTKAVFRLPYIKHYADECPIAVNRAEVILKVDQTFSLATGNYEPPLQISLIAVDGEGREIYIKDQFYTADILKFGGTYDATNKQYVFNMARHVQDIMSGKIENYGFNIVVANTDKLSVPRRDNKAERVVLGGTSSALYAPKFTLTYIRFPNDK